MVARKKIRGHADGQNDGRYTSNSFEEAGYRACCVFHNLRNSSTRCEVGAGLVAMSPPVEANIGVDNKTCVDTGNDIIDHARLKTKTVLRTKGGAPILGGRKTRLHQSSASKKTW